MVVGVAAVDENFVSVSVGWAHEQQSRMFQRLRSNSERLGGKAEGMRVS